MPEVVSIHVAPGHRSAMQPRAAISVEAGAGIVGDRYHGSRHRHLTVQARDELDAAAVVLGGPVDDAATRRNVTVATGPLPSEPGDRLRIGPVELEVVRVAAPCRVMEETLGVGGRASLRRRGGVVCRVLTSGRVRIGDEFHVVSRSEQP
ncbi:sulfurase [Marmoricola endophyticus]|uniref:Sulfurase n=1 Tax=Marmoricola endophyticus TaxID=2040280 RepID=A0A917B9M4_9ACTN|nr:MOSC domain-containing protein [Marmoricola endophyticus]GGF32652.1 sulfurase [Marmoricola endophyticus]